MDFGFSEEQEMLRSSARDFLAKECPMTYVRRMMEDDRGFTVGLFSIADALLQTPLPQLLDGLPFDDRLTGALLDHSGPEGRIVAAALAYERGHFAAVAEHHDLAKFGQAYYDAVAWATEMVVELR